eukprot:TRINITY_DN11129_c0_g1_i5.p1 TRINITY_DN11129_c0_g1~~TRINITY_DN11129_c0_g1_i5.p1  ORF type:complete len:629 (-),score=70.60 TRINITY_DN11129_c0_g1_i5:68-1954(-)
MASARISSAAACSFYRWRDWLHERVSIRFEDKEEERAFVEHLAPQVTKWTLVGHVIAFCFNSLNFIWNIAWMGISWQEFGSGEHDHLHSYVGEILISFGIHSVIIAALLLAYFVRLRKARCELISISATALLAMMMPWLNPWHGIRIFGGDPDDVWGPGAKDNEALRILYIVAGIHAYALYVPIRWRFSFVVPMCCTFSFIVLVCIVGSSFEASALVVLPLVTFLLFAPVLGQRSHEVLVRERWLALHQVAEREEELYDMQAMSHVMCDVTFKLTRSLCFSGLDKFRDAFLGGAVEGTSILDLMSEEDSKRFMSSIDRMSMTHIPENLSVTFKRHSGTLDVKLVIVEAHKQPVGEDAMFLVSLTISKAHASLHEAPQSIGSTLATLPSSTLTSLPPLDEEQSFAQIVPVRQDSKSLSDLSFTYSADSALSPVAPPTTVVLHGITEVDPPPVTEDAAVNTTWVWQKDTFTCSLCAKPPKLPGPLPRLPQSRTRRRKKKQQQQKHYEGNDFDGVWALREEEAEGVPDWLRNLVIDGAHVVLGDLSTTTIVVGDSPDDVFLSSGKIWLGDDGTLIRQSNSGRILRFTSRLWDDDEDDMSDSSSIASFAPLEFSACEGVIFVGGECEDHVAQ